MAPKVADLSDLPQGVKPVVHVGVVEPDHEVTADDWVCPDYKEDTRRQKPRPRLVLNSRSRGSSVNFNKSAKIMAVKERRKNVRHQKFDGTKGYPGEGPCGCKWDHSLYEEVPFNMKKHHLCDDDRDCLIEGHYHRVVRQSKDGATRRLKEKKAKDEKKAKPRKQSRYLCRSILPDATCGPHTHNDAHPIVVHQCEDVMKLTPAEQDVWDQAQPMNTSSDSTQDGGPEDVPDFSRHASLFDDDGAPPPPRKRVERPPVPAGIKITPTVKKSLLAAQDFKSSNSTPLAGGKTSGFIQKVAEGFEAFDTEEFLEDGHDGLTDVEDVPEMKREKRIRPELVCAPRPVDYPVDPLDRFTPVVRAMCKAVDWDGEEDFEHWYHKPNRRVPWKNYQARRLTPAEQDWAEDHQYDDIPDHEDEQQDEQHESDEGGSENDEEETDVRYVLVFANFTDLVVLPKLDWKIWQWAKNRYVDVLKMCGQDEVLVINANDLPVNEVQLSVVDTFNEGAQNFRILRALGCDEVITRPMQNYLVAHFRQIYPHCYRVPVYADIAAEAMKDREITKLRGVHADQTVNPNLTSAINLFLSKTDTNRVAAGMDSIFDREDVVLNTHLHILNRCVLTSIKKNAVCEPHRSILPVPKNYVSGPSMVR